MEPEFAAFTAPPLALFGSEPLRALVELTSARWSPRGREGTAHAALADGHPVVLFPGLASFGAPFASLKKLCAGLGAPAVDWGRGLNTGPSGDVNAWIAELADEVEEMIESHGRAATLIGWSLGGIYAREIARQRPALARQVITFGTPFAGNIEQTRAGWVYRLLNKQPAQIDEALLKQLRSCPPVPTTSILSRADGVVAWQACVQRGSRGRFENIEVAGSHLGMCWNPQVAAIVADRLTQPEGEWRPYAGKVPAAN